MRYSDVEIKVMNYIDGEFCEASTGQRIQDIGPMDGKASLQFLEVVLMMFFERCNVHDLLRKLGCSNIRGKSNWLHKIADKMQENIEEIARLESLDTENHGM